MEESLLGRPAPLWIAGYNLFVALVAVIAIGVVTTTRQMAPAPAAAGADAPSIAAFSAAADLPGGRK